MRDSHFKHVSHNINCLCLPTHLWVFGLLRFITNCLYAYNKNVNNCSYLLTMAVGIAKTNIWNIKFDCEITIKNWNGVSTYTRYASSDLIFFIISAISSFHAPNFSPIKVIIRTRIQYFFLRVTLNERLILLILSCKGTTFFWNIQVVGYVFFIFFSGFVH